MKGRRSAVGPFVQGIVLCGDGHTRITQGPGFRVDGGTADGHALASALVQDLASRVQVKPPRCFQEIRDQFRDVLARHGVQAKG